MAYACWRCNRHKGSDLGSFDPQTGEFSFLFNSQAEVEQIMAQCAQAIRETAEARNWDACARRAAQYAFGAVGDLAKPTLRDRQMPRLEGHLEKLLELEQGVVALREREITQERGFLMER